MRDGKIDVQKLITKLGSTYRSLVGCDAIPELPLQQFYENDDTYGLEPAPGIELMFSPENLCFDAMYVFLIDEQASGLGPYLGELPAPYHANMTQHQVRADFGLPYSTRGPTTEPNIELVFGACDTYLIDSTIHPSAQVEIQYDQHRRVATLVFSANY